MKEIRPGLFETLLTEELERALSELPTDHIAEVAKLNKAEVADRISLHMSRVIERALSSVGDDTRLDKGVALARTLVPLIQQELGLRDDLSGDRPSLDGQVLAAVIPLRPDGKPSSVERPLTPLLDTTLLTNAPGEPTVGKQIHAEIASADRIDVVMAFIRQTGIRPLRDALRRHCEAGRPLRVLTTTYTQSTELAALQTLRELGAEVRVSYDKSTTRLHAKAWLFHRESGYSTAFIGSSNLTYSAQVSGLEWNVRASSARNSAVVDKVVAVFESYWHGGDFRDLDVEEFRAELKRAKNLRGTFILSPIEVRLEPFQERLLERVELSRERGQSRNLLVSATGTGKTVMAAVDYKRLKSRLDRSRLLFIAHRREILQQSLGTFKQVLGDPTFGELWTGTDRPDHFEHVFASIQTLARQDLAHLDPAHFDVVVVDEFHHAAAPSYEKLLEHVQPRQLLGLTATPERTDGLDILGRFGGRIAAELRLWDAIDQHRLTPFAYFGVHDDLDLTKVPWRRGRGYDEDGLTQVMTANDVWAHQVAKSLSQHVDDVAKIRCLGFCVSVKHAKFMARVFNELGIASAAVWGDSPAEERARALDELRGGKIRVLFSVDLFNEGVDLPKVDTLLLLRPTESPVLFLQQLGRGLRRADGKRLCTVLDFVGHHRSEFRFDRKLLALMGGTRRQLEKHVQAGFPYLPAGCHMELDRVASEIILRSLKEAIPSRWNEKVDELKRLAGERPDPSLADYLEETGLELDDVYGAQRGWSDLRTDAGLAGDPADDSERALRRGVGRLLHVDDAERITSYPALLAHGWSDFAATATERERRVARMLLSQLGDQIFTGDMKETRLEEAHGLATARPEVVRGVKDLMSVLDGQIDHLHRPLESHPDVPLVVHGRYTRLEILAAFGVGGTERAKVAAWQTGVRHVPEAQADLLAFTLDKSAGSFSPTTRYRDYAISPTLIHWESQNNTRADGRTGMRYREHQEKGSHVFLFARMTTNERAFYFLGPATYVEHRGERPMAITWKLRYPLPGDLFAQFGAAVA